jgi:hypothetical protein
MKLFEEDIAPLEVEADPFADAPDLDFFRRMYREFHRNTEEARQLSLKDSEYYHGFKQLDTAMRAELARRKQPPAYVNRTRFAVLGILGLVDSNQTDPEAVGRNDDDEGAAQVVTQMLRYLGDKSDFSAVKRDASHDFLVYGTMASTVELEDGDTPRPMAKHLPWREFFYDPLSLRHDFADAKYKGKARWVDEDIAKRMFPDASKRIGDMASSDFSGEGAECQPIHRKLWLDRDRKQVLINEVYYRDGLTGRWKQAIYCHAGLLHWSDSPYLDDEGMTVCPIQAVSYEVDDEGQRYGMIRDMRPLQDIINNNWSKQTHILNSAQVEVDPSGNANPVDAEKARQEALDPNGVMPQGYKRVTMTDVFQGVGMMLDKAMTMLDRMAPSQALLGRAGGANESGRARQILQQAGYTELSRALGRFEHWELANYRQLWFCAAQYMTDEQVILVTDDAGARQKLMLNRIQYEAQTQQGIDPQTGQPIEQTVMVEVGRENELARMDMDVTLKVIREADSLRGEATRNMLEWSAKTGIGLLAPEFEMVLEMSDIPQKPYLLEKYRKLRSAAEAKQAEAQQAQAQQAQQLQAVNEAATQSKIIRDQAQAGKDQALADKHGVEAQSEQLELAIKEAMLADLGPI